MCLFLSTVFLTSFGWLYAVAVARRRGRTRKCVSSPISLVMFGHDKGPSNLSDCRLEHTTISCSPLFSSVSNSFSRGLECTTLLSTSQCPAKPNYCPPLKTHFAPPSPCHQCAMQAPTVIVLPPPKPATAASLPPLPPPFPPPPPLDLPLHPSPRDGPLGRPHCRGLFRLLLARRGLKCLPPKVHRMVPLIIAPQPVLLLPGALMARQHAAAVRSSERGERGHGGERGWRLTGEGGLHQGQHLRHPTNGKGRR